MYEAYVMHLTYPAVRERVGRKVLAVNNVANEKRQFEADCLRGVRGDSTGTANRSHAIIR